MLPPCSKNDTGQMTIFRDKIDLHVVTLKCEYAQVLSRHDGIKQ